MDKSLLNKNNFIKQLWPFIQPFKYELSICFLLMCVGALSSLIPSYLIISLTNNVLFPIQNNLPVQEDVIEKYLSYIFIAGVFAWILNSTQKYILAYISEKIAANLRQRLISHLIKLSIDYFSENRVSELITRITSDTYKINIFISVYLLNFIQDFVISVMILMFLFFINAQLALYTITPLLFILLLTYTLKTKLSIRDDHATKIWYEMVSVVSDIIHGMRVIKCFGQEDKELKKFSEINQRTEVIHNKMNKIWALFIPTTTWFIDLGLLVIWAQGIEMMIQKNLTIGALTGFIGYSSKLFSCSESIVKFFEEVTAVQASLKKLYEILQEKSLVQESKNAISVSPLKGKIEIRNVNFFYNQKKALDNINLIIHPGEKIAIVGHNGAGKSTLMNLICRFYDPNSGDIYIDDHNLKDIAINDYHKNIGIVLQDSFLFYGTIGENIAYSKNNASLQEIVAAAKDANAHEFILKQPLGYDTILSEGGGTLSGGERQKIAIARAFLADPHILFLDEATSAMDPYNKNVFEKSIKQLTKGRTTIVISHHLGTLNDFDKLIFMKDGQIIEEGTHQGLMDKNGQYCKFYQLDKNLNEGELR